jgi:hypothetical protein
MQERGYQKGSKATIKGFVQHVGWNNDKLFGSI